MKRIIIISSFAATALFTLTGGVQAQNSIEQVLKNIETNNKELQANAQLITSQKLESKTDNNLTDYFFQPSVQIVGIHTLFHKSHLHYTPTGIINYPT